MVTLDKPRSENKEKVFYSCKDSPSSIGPVSPPEINDGRSILISSEMCVNPPKPKTQEPDQYTNNRIYVSNIPFSFREHDLHALFSPFGIVVSALIVCNERGSKGFGFVTMDSIESCERARKNLHGKKILGRTIEVRKATSPPKPITSRNYGRNHTHNIPQPNASHVATKAHINSGLQANLIHNQLHQQQLNLFLTQNPLVLQSLLSATAPVAATPPGIFNVNPLVANQPLGLPPINPFQVPAYANLQANAAQAAPAHQPFAYSLGSVNAASGFPLANGLSPYNLPFGSLVMQQKSPSPQPPASLNNSQLSTSMASHARLMQDQLVNLLNLDGTLNTSLYIDQSRQNLNASLQSSKSILNGSSDSEDSKNMRKRPSGDMRQDNKVLRMRTKAVAGLALQCGRSLHLHHARTPFLAINHLSIRCRSTQTI
ncbi:unnamed protein product [Auanema sp. JU1783]|nr:unnamed protein product [Auanema sp. JU1783]